MLSARDPETPQELRKIAFASERMYPEFIQSLQEHSDAKIDYRPGTLLIRDSRHVTHTSQQLGCPALDPADVERREPALSLAGRSAFLLPDASVDPRELMHALVAAARLKGIHIAHGSAVRKLEVENGRIAGVHTERTHYLTATAINCAGAWAGEISPLPLPIKPVKGHMLDVIAPPDLLRNTIRAPEVYIVPRTGGRILIGATVEDAGFDKHIDPETIQRLYRSAMDLVPALSEARIHEVWTGLRPGTPDGLPIIGSTAVSGYFLATGHYRNGILLAPITAKIIGSSVRNESSAFDLDAFSPDRLAQ